MLQLRHHVWRDFARLHNPFASLAARPSITAQSYRGLAAAAATASNSPRRPKKRNRNKVTRRMRQQREGPVDDNENGDVEHEHFRENDSDDIRQSHEHEYEHEDEDKEHIDDTDEKDAASLTKAARAGLAAHIARVRAFKRDNRSLHSFIRAVTDDFSIPRDLAHRIQLLCDDRNYEKGLNEQYRASDPALYQLATNAALQYSIVARVLSEVMKRAPALASAPSLSVLDASFGVGAAAWGVRQSLRNVRDYTAIEASSSHRSLGKQLTQHLPLTFKHLSKPPSANAASDTAPVNVAINAFGLANLGRHQRRDMLDSMWCSLSEGGVLVLIEAGSREGFETVRAAREYLLDRHRTKPSTVTAATTTDNHNNPLLPPLPAPPAQSSATAPGHAMVLAPCGHDMICPQGKSGLCRFGHRTQTSSLPTTTPARNVNSDDALGGLNISHFSYVVLHKGPVNTTGLSMEQRQLVDHRYHRVVRPSLVRSGHTIVDLCTTDAKLERRVIPKSAGLTGGYMQAKDSRWGDLWQFDRIVSKTQQKKLRRAEQLKSEQAKAVDVTVKTSPSQSFPSESLKVKPVARMPALSVKEAVASLKEAVANLQPGDSLEEFVKRRRALLESKRQARATKKTTGKAATTAATAEGPANGIALRAPATAPSETDGFEDVDEWDEDDDDDDDDGAEELDRESERERATRRSASASRSSAATRH